jgi:signal transduction histidine kinase
MQEPRIGHDARLLRRAARTIAVQVALAVAAVVLFTGAAVFYVEERQQQAQADQATRDAWASADDVDDPPARVWLAIHRKDGEHETSPGAPAAVRAIDPSVMPDGASRIVQGDVEIVVWSGDRRLGRVSAFYDLSSREEEEDRLFVSLTLASMLGIIGAVAVGAVIGRRAVRPLGEAMALQRRFVANASHELRTPLSVLQLRAQILKRHLAPSIPSSEVAELERLVADTKVMGEVVNDLLLSAELEHNTQTGEPVDLEDIAADVVHSLQPLAQQRSVDLTMTAGAGAGSGVLIVNGVPAALRRALVSLVDNAIAHTDAGGHVWVEAAREGQLAVVRVRDNGEGLDPATAGRLVARFARGTKNDTGRRFGLGLSLVDEVARAHGGRLEISGERGQGATFTLCVPVSPGRQPL